MTLPDLIALAKSIAIAHQLDPALVCAVCDHESVWDPWAVRYEPAFEKRWDPTVGLTPTEHYGRAVSYGLGQIMGEVARELGFAGKYLTELCDPATGLEFMCRKLARCVASFTDKKAALERYNGGSDLTYAATVIALIPKYESNPVTTL